MTKMPRVTSCPWDLLCWRIPEVSSGPNATESGVVGATLQLVAGSTQENVTDTCHRTLICELREKPGLDVQKEACAGVSCSAMYKEILDHLECQQQETGILHGHEKLCFEEHLNDTNAHTGKTV